MSNSQILFQLEKQRDGLFEKLNNKSISALYLEQYSQIKSGEIFVLNNQEAEVLNELKLLAKDKTFDIPFKNKLKEYTELNNEYLVNYFTNEFENIFAEILLSNKQDEIQAVFIEYDYYYHFTSCILCYGKRDYPLIEEPRYIWNELSFIEPIFVIENGINFEPSWISCQEFEKIDHLEIDYELQNLFLLHSRTLLHKALFNLDAQKKLDFFHNKPFSFYINEHDCEEMLFYRIN